VVNVCVRVCACVCVCVCVRIVTGEGVRGVMLHSFLVVAGDDEADELSPGRRKGKRDVRTHRGG